MTPRRELSYECREAGKRIADQINAHVHMHPGNLMGKWMGFALSDGSTRGDIYDSLAEAKRFTDEWRTAYFDMTSVLGGVTPDQAARYLDFHREAREANLAHRDPATQVFMGPVTRG